MDAVVLIVLIIELIRQTSGFAISFSPLFTQDILRFLHGAYSRHCVPARPELYVYIMNAFDISVSNILR